MWAVCGPPRSGTTYMLELVAAWMDLTVVWNVALEWRSRKENHLREHFYEMEPTALCERPHGIPYDRVVIKILDPDVDVDVTRAILMIRDPEDVHRSAFKLGQRIYPDQVVERVNQFRERFAGRVDEVQFEELQDLRALFGRLKGAGWPVTDPVYTMETRAVRHG